MRVDLYVAAVPADIPAWVMHRLDASEQARAARFVQAADRRAYMAAHGLLHLALDRAAIPPDEREFETDTFGKPRLVGLDRKVHFNLSHCRAWVAVAISRCGEVGVDIETDDRMPMLAGMDDAWLSKSERDDLNETGAFGSALRRLDILPLPHGSVATAARTGLKGPFLPAAAQRLAWWVSKEALVKAAGLGLNQPLSDLTLPQVTGPGWYQARQLPLAFGPTGPAVWPWCLWRMDDFWLGLAVKHSGGALPPVQLQCMAFTPDGPHFSAVLSGTAP